jgi:hypothetical protein
MSEVKYNDYPVQDCLRDANKLIERGAMVYQKFTCDKCGSRQTIDIPNTFYAKGQCEECSHITDIEKKGCNYLLVSKLSI